MIAPGGRRSSRRETRAGFLRIYVWEAPVRTAHWLVVLSLIVLSITGYYISNPFIVVAGEARQHFVTGYVRVIHSYTAIVFTLALLSRLAWMFLGNAYARWDQFIPWSRERRRGVLEMLKYYLFLIDRPTPGAGHNALAGLTYVFTYVVLFLQALTGLGLYGRAAHIGSPLHHFAFLANVFGGAQTTRWLHHGFMWFLLGFFVHHLYSVLLFSFQEKTGTTESIISGYKFVPLERAPEIGRGGRS